MAVFRFIFRNWPLKLAAAVLATLLYVGLIVSATADTFVGKVPIQIRNEPAGAIVLGGIEDVTSIRYLIVGTNRPTITTGSFTATIDLGGVQVTPGMAPVSVPIVVRASDAGSVQILDFTPQRIQVTLDPLATKSVPVRVDQGTIPAGLDPGPAVLADTSVLASGPDSMVRKVTSALARVRIDPSGTNVNTMVSLVAVDAQGDAVDSVELTPDATRVQIRVDATVTTKTLPIRPVVSGTPATQVTVTSTTVEPLQVTVQGPADVLAGLNAVDTKPVAVAGATADVTKSVGLDLPENVEALGIETVKVVVTLEPVVGSRSFEIGVTIVNEDPTTTYTIIVDRVIATVGGPLSRLDALDATTLAGRLDVDGLGPGTHRVTVTLALPSSLTLISISPQEVSVIVTPRPTPAPTPSPSATPLPSAAVEQPTPSPSSAP